MVPSWYPPVVYMSQYDVGRPIGFVVSASGSTPDFDNYTVTLEGTRSDGTPVTAPVTTDGNICAFETTATMTNKMDRYPAQIVVTDGNGNRIASIPVTMMVVKAAMDENAEGVEEDRSLYQQYTGTVQSLIADIRTQLNAETAARQAAVSAEASARQAADNQLQSNINTEASTRATQDASLQSQINQLIAPSGEAPSAAEVENARVGVDGTVYSTLGDAIRTQVTDVKSALDLLYDKDTEAHDVVWSDAAYTNVPNGWNLGYYNASTGAKVTSYTYILTNPNYYFSNEDATILEATAPSGNYIAAYEYDADGNFIQRIGDPNAANSSTRTNHLLFSFDKGHKFKFTVGKFSGQTDSESHINDTSFLSSIAVTFYVTSISQLDNYVENGNNVLQLRPLSENTFSGVKISISNNVLTLKGTATATFRIKVSNGYEYAGSIPDAWKSETVPQFVVGKKYSLHNQIISGNLPSSVGVSLRDSSGSSVVSASIPEATLSAAVAFAMLYVPINTVLDVSFIPMFINGGVEDAAYTKVLNPVIYINGIKKYKKPDMSADFIYDSTLQSAIKLPNNYVPAGEPTPMIILCHGLSSTISSSTWGGTDMETLVGHFVDEGFAVIDVNQVTTQDWCNPDLIKKYVNAIRDATERYNVIPKIVYGESMGSLIGLCIATLYPSVKSCVISGIRLDLAARYEQMSVANKEIVNENLGFTNGYNALIAAGWDKTAISCVTIDGDKVCPVNFPPTFFVVGSADTPTKTESLAKIDEIKRGGTICKTTEYTGDHNDVCYLKVGSSLTDAIAWMHQWI